MNEFPSFSKNCLDRFAFHLTRVCHINRPEVGMFWFDVANVASLSAKHFRNGEAFAGSSDWWMDEIIQDLSELGTCHSRESIYTYKCIF
jgi:hypothetical protein